MTTISRTASSKLPTPFGEFELVHYQGASLEALALVYGEIGTEAVLCRVHSECMTGEVFGSLRCDCKAQLELAQKRICAEGQGVIVYLRQEGRGIGLGNKIKAYALQDQGRDTIEANLELGFAADERAYDVAAAILRELKVASVRLLTNNPEKMSGLRDAGIEVVEQVSHWAEFSVFSEAYIETKRQHMGHILDHAAPDASSSGNTNSDNTKSDNTSSGSQSPEQTEGKAS